MIEFIDKTSTASGTPINRANLMAIQGFVAKTTAFNADGSIVETNDRGEVLTTVFGTDGSITQMFQGQFTLYKVTIFEANGSIREEIM